MKRKDWIAIVVIGAAVGLLSQPILANVADSFHINLTLGVRVGMFLGFTVLAPIALLIFYLLGKAIPVLYQFGKFAAVGTLNSFVDLGVFNLETLLLGVEPSGLVFAVFKSVSFLCGTTNSYFWNRGWTFHAGTKPTGREAVFFYIVAILGGLVNVGVATYVFGGVTPPAFISAKVWTNLVSPVSGIFAGLLWDFLGYKYLVFKKTADRV